MTKSQRPPWLGEDRRGWDHIRVHVQLLRDPEIGVYELAVYCGLVAHAELSTGEAHPSIETLAGYGEMSERRARDAVGTLVRLGYIDATVRPGTSSSYVVLPPPPRHLLPGSDDDTPAPPAANPGTTRRDTPAPRADEQEPVEQEPENETPGEGVDVVAADTPGHDDRPEVIELCEHLADRIEAHGAVGARPPVTAKWRKDMRLLLERGWLHDTNAGPCTPEKVHRSIDAVFDQLATPGPGRRPFCWADQIRSPHALRDHWVQLGTALRQQAVVPQSAREARVVRNGQAARIAAALGLDGSATVGRELPAAGGPTR